MDSSQGFSVEITSGYDYLWRYNLAVTCGCFDECGKGEDNPRRDVIAVEDFVAPVGSNLSRKPADCPEKRGIRFSTVACDYLMMYIYVIPHSLPADRDIADNKPFDMHISVRKGDTVILDRMHPVNCWSGASVEMRLPKPETV